MEGEEGEDGGQFMCPRCGLAEAFAAAALEGSKPVSAWLNAEVMDKQRQQRATRLDRKCAKLQKEAAALQMQRQQLLDGSLVVGAGAGTGGPQAVAGTGAGAGAGAGSAGVASSGDRCLTTENAADMLSPALPPPSLPPPSLPTHVDAAAGHIVDATSTAMEIVPTAPAAGTAAAADTAADTAALASVSPALAAFTATAQREAALADLDGRIAQCAAQRARAAAERTAFHASRANSDAQYQSVVRSWMAGVSGVFWPGTELQVGSVFFSFLSFD
jgi:hypothetical protein